MRNLEGLSHGESDIHKLMDSLSDTDIIDYVNQQKQATPNLLLLKTWALTNLGKVDVAIQILTELINSEDKYIKSEAFLRMSSSLWMKGDLTKAKYYNDKALDMLQFLDPGLKHAKRIEGWITFRRGAIVLSQGDLNQGLLLTLRSLEIARELEDNIDVSVALNNLGTIYNAQGDLAKALECINEAFLINKSKEGMKNQHRRLSHELVFLDSLVGIHWNRNDRDTSLKYAREALHIADSIGNEISIAQILFRIIDIQLQTDEFQSAQQYLDKLEKISEKNESKFIKQIFKMSYAKILKYSPRGLQKYRAQELFKEVLSENNINGGFKSNCRLHLMDLLLDELNHYSTDEVMQEILSLSSEIYETAQEHFMIPLTIKALIFKAKLETINANFELANSLLDQAIILAEEREYKQLMDKAIKERLEIHNNFDDWEKMIMKGAPLRDMMKKSKIKEYLDEVISNYDFQ